MSYFLPESPIWPDSVYQVPDDVKILGWKTVPIVGTEYGFDNRTAQDLTNRLTFLHDTIIGDIMPVANPDAPMPMYCQAMRDPIKGLIIRLRMDQHITITDESLPINHDVSYFMITIADTSIGVAVPDKVKRLGIQSISITDNLVDFNIGNTYLPTYQGALFYNGGAGFVSLDSPQQLACPAFIRTIHYAAG